MEKQTKLYRTITTALFTTILLIFFLSCKKNKTEIIKKNTTYKITENMNIEIDKIKKHIELQKRVETEEKEYDNPYNLSLEDLELTYSIINKQLQKSGFKNISDDEFEKKINLIFNINLKNICLGYQNNNNFITLFGDLMDGNLNTLINNQYQLYFYTQNIFFSKKSHFLLHMFTLEEIIIINNDNSYSLKVPEYIIARNKYLFNNSKVSLTWLKFHDEFFLESLVKTFGYVEDKNLLEWVINRNILKSSEDDVNEFSKILWIRNCDNKIEIHKEVFELMLTESESNREKYKTSLLVFLDSMQDKKTDLSFSELTKIKALVCYYGTKMTNGSYYSFFSYMNKEEYEEEFEKNNYYNIPDFKKIYNETKYQGIWLPGMPE